MGATLIQGTCMAVFGLGKSLDTWGDMAMLG